MKKAIKSMLSTTMIAALAMTAISGCASSTGGQGETQAPSQTEAKTDAGTTAAGDAGEQSKEAQGAVELSGRNKLAFFLPMTGDQMQYGSINSTRPTEPTLCWRSLTTRGTRRRQ